MCLVSDLDEHLMTIDVVCYNTVGTTFTSRGKAFFVFLQMFDIYIRSFKVPEGVKLLCFHVEIN